MHRWERMLLWQQRWVLSFEEGAVMYVLITMDGEHVQGSPHDLDVRPSYSTLCNPQQVISCSGCPSGIANELITVYT